MLDNTVKVHIQRYGVLTLKVGTQTGKVAKKAFAYVRRGLRRARFSKCGFASKRYEH